MTDEERLLEIATRLLGKGSLVIIDQEIVLAFDAAERILKTWRERTGAREERGQDVQEISDERLEAIRQALWSAAEVADANGAFDAMDQMEYEAEQIAEIQRARAAGKGDG